MAARLAGFALMSGAMLALTRPAFGATVTESNPKKKAVIIELEDGETYEKGAEICFFTTAGKKIDCGTVAKVKGNQGLVKMKSAKRFKRLKPGTPAHAPEASEGGEATGGDEDKEAKDGKGAAADKTYKGKDSPFRIWGYYSPALATPSKFNKLGYAAPSTTTPDTLWASDATVASALFGFNVQVGIPIGAFSLNPGVRYRSFTPSLIDSDYIPNEQNPYVSTEEKATALGLFVDFQFFRLPMLSQSALWASSGIDVDSSTVSLKATKKDDSGKTPESQIAKATSKLTVASLRVSSGFDLVFAKPMGAFFGVTLMVPLATFGAAFSGNLGDDEARGLAEPGDDLKKALGHTKNSVAYEVSLGGVLAF